MGQSVPHGSSVVINHSQPAAGIHSVWACGRNVQQEFFRFNRPAQRQKAQAVNQRCLGKDRFVGMRNLVILQDRLVELLLA